VETRLAEPPEAGRHRRRRPALAGAVDQPFGAQAVLGILEVRQHQPIEGPRVRVDHPAGPRGVARVRAGVLLGRQRAQQLDEVARLGHRDGAVDAPKRSPPGQRQRDEGLGPLERRPGPRLPTHASIAEHPDVLGERTHANTGRHAGDRHRPGGPRAAVNDHVRAGLARSHVALVHQAGDRVPTLAIVFDRLAKQRNLAATRAMHAAVGEHVVGSLDEHTDRLLAVGEGEEADLGRLAGGCLSLHRRSPLS
jgi:hypothetical protein